MKTTNAVIITGKLQKFTVLVNSKNTVHPIASSEIFFVETEAISIGQAHKNAIDILWLQRSLDMRPIVRSTYQ